MFSILPFLVAFYFLLVGIFVLRQNRNNLLAKIFFALCFTTFAWQFSWSILFQIKDYYIAYLIAKLGWMLILFLPTILYHFLVILSEKKDELKKVYYSYGFSFLLLLTLIFSNNFISGVYSYFFGYYPKAGIIHPLHVLQTTIVVLRGLYITYEKRNIVTNYKTKSQLDYCIASLLIYLFAAVDYLCNYGLEFYPPGIIFITISLSIISYSIIKHRLLDLNLAISLVLSRIIVYSGFLVIFILLNFLITRRYLSQNLFYFFGTFVTIIFICEIYNYLLKRVQSFSDSIIVKQKKENKARINLLNQYLESSVSVEQLFANIKSFMETNLKVDLISFFIKNEFLDNSQNTSIDVNYVDLVSENNFLINLSQDFVDHVVSSRLLIEHNEYPKEILNYKKSQVFIPFVNSKNLMGFILLSSNEDFKFWHYEIFDLLTINAGTVIDRIRLYNVISSQKQKFFEEKTSALKSFAGSIAHELRNPLNAVNLTVSQLPDLVNNINDNQLKNDINYINRSILSSINQANETINIILADISEKPITEDQFSLIKTQKAIPKIIDSFGYRNLEEKSRVRFVDNGNDFVFRAVIERFTFIIYNLLKNALYYLKEYPDSMVTIGLESRTIDGKNWNVIYVRDTGPGVPPEVLPKLFGDFFTSGKKDGTGLGLAFCKRNMQIFGGDIICESEYGGQKNKTSWTKFSLLFPVISSEEVAKAEFEDRRKKILLVDDQQTNLLATKSRIEKVLTGVSCDIALGGEEAIAMARNHNYQLILMDIQMPGTDGVEATRKIRNFHEQIPIIAFTSLETKEFDLGAFNYYLSKNDESQSFYRNITKWLTDLEDSFAYLGSKEEYIEVLRNKKILFADDQQMNRMMMKKALEANGLIITEAKDGKELLDIYQKNLDQNGKTSFDMILTDINMPPFNGDEAVKQIRKIEAQNKITNQEEIPIIALTGDGQREDIHYFFRCQMTDYFIKGTNPENLIKIIASYLAKKTSEGQDDKVEEQLATNKTELIINKHQNQDSEILNPNNIASFNKTDQQKILQLFLEEAEKIISQIKASKEEHDLKEISFLLHSLKGTSGNVGAKKLHNYVEEIESIFGSGKLPDNQNWFNDLEDIYSELKEAIEVILKG